jgi:chloramphenicol 3-O-phosphotransferase
VISDVHEHERRLRDRDRGLPHVGEPTWPDVQRRHADYTVWTDEILEFDTSEHSVDVVAAEIAERLASS